MNPKIPSILEKVSKEKSRGNYAKALKRITAAIEEYPDELELYKEAIGLGIDAGEPLQTIKYFKKALSLFRSERDVLHEYAAALEKKSCDPVFGKYLLENSIKNKDLQQGFHIVQAIDEHILEDLLLRTCRKRETLSSALRGGHKLDGELSINEISEAILHLALGNIREAVQIVIQQLDSNNLECSVIEPLLVNMEKTFPRNGHVRYALGNCYLSNGEINRGVNKIVQAVKMNPDLVDDIARRLERTVKKDGSHHENLEFALFEVYSLQENISKVSTLAQSILDATPQKAPQVLDLLKKVIEKSPSNRDLEELYLDASLSSDQSQRIRGYLESTWQQKDKRRNNLDWLEAHSKSGSLPVDLQIYFGKLVLNEGRSDWAINIFKRTMSESPSEAQNIIHILDKRQHSEPQVGEFCRELKSASQDNAYEGEFDIQSFDKAEFSLSAFEQDAKVQDFELENNLFGEGPVPTAPGSDTISSEDARMADLAGQEADEMHKPPSDPRPPEEAITETTSEKPKTNIPFPFTEKPTGRLDNEAILNHIETAIDEGRFDEAKSLLDFKPVTIREEVSRILCLADYYFYTDQPLSALIALKSFDCNALTREEKRDHLTSMAACYRALKLFEAAHSVYINLMNDEPSNAHLVSLAKANYIDYLKERCEEALVLEKICFLDS
jgi:tetratricopeptide (TPR) repeat protein